MPGVSLRLTRTLDVPSAGQGASALSPTQSRRGIAAPVYFLLIAAVVVALTQGTVVPAATSPHATTGTSPPAARLSWADTGLAALRTATTTTTAPAPPPTTTTTTTTTTSRPAAPPPAATVPAPPAAALPARGQATAWGCDAALAYLRAYAAPGFALQCPGYAEGHEGMTCNHEPGSCPGTGLIAIADACPQSYMNEASNSWVVIGRSNAPIDPYGACP